MISETPTDYKNKVKVELHLTLLEHNMLQAALTGVGGFISYQTERGVYDKSSFYFILKAHVPIALRPYIDPYYNAKTRPEDLALEVVDRIMEQYEKRKKEKATIFHKNT